MDKLSKIKVIDYPVLTEKRLELTKEYNKIHYGLDTFELKFPEIVVIHYTAISSLETTLKVFKKDTISSAGRPYIAKYGKVNVGIHFVVAKNGDIYSLFPEMVTARHTIGLNHLSFGIENVALDETELTNEQLLANADIIEYLLKKYISIKYIIGHHEYARKDYPHYELYKELVKNYKPTVKVDPGDKFMKDLFSELEKRKIFK